MPNWQDVSPLALAGLSLLAGYWLGRWRDNAKVAHERRAALVSEFITKCHVYFAPRELEFPTSEEIAARAIDLAGLASEMSAYCSMRTVVKIQGVVNRALTFAADVKGAEPARLAQVFQSGSRTEFYLDFIRVVFYLRCELGTATPRERFAHLPPMRWAARKYRAIKSG